MRAGMMWMNKMKNFNYGMFYFSRLLPVTCVIASFVGVSQIKDNFFGGILFMSSIIVVLIAYLFWKIADIE
jgi:hypothetical protein